MSLYLYLSVHTSVRPCHFWAIIHVARNCAQCMRPQTTGSNPLSGSIICPSVRPVVRGPFVVFVFVLISSVGVQRRNSFIPTLGSGGHQWGPVEIVCLSICPSVSPPLCPVFCVAFWQSFVRPVITRSTCGHRPRGQIPLVAV